MADKEVPLSIVLRTVDKATAGIQAVNKRLDAITRPTREFGKALSELADKSGLNGVVAGFRGVGGAIEGLLGKVAVIGGVVGLAVHGLVGMVDEFDNLGDKAEKLGVTVDFLASMRFAAERSGASVESLDQGITAFGESMGQLRAGGGRMLKFLSSISPALVTQLKATKGNEAAFRLLADAMAAVTDPQKRLALALKTVGNSELAPMLARGSAGLLELQGEFIGTAGSLEDAAEKAGQTDDAMKKLKAATTGVKAALLTGLAPALTLIIEKMTTWLSGHREDLKRWATDIGEKLPRAVEEVVRWVGRAIDKVTKFVEDIGGWKTAAVGLAAVLAGPLLSSVANLTAELVSMLAKLVALPGALTSASSAASTAAGAASSATSAGGLGGALKFIPAVGLGIAGGAAFHEETQKMLREQDQPTTSQAVNRALFNLTAARTVTEARIKIDIANAPRGTRATADPRNTADVDLTVGHQLAGFGS